uniref:Uncharacterized protein n=1 Tax=Magallana gigas TaxID=29159 RepID=A0A8W8MT67_MAGGI
MDYSGEGPWSPLIPNSTCEPMEEDHVADQEMAPESMETDEASTSTRTNPSQIGFGENPEQGMRLTDLFRELEDMFDNILTETARGLDPFFLSLTSHHSSHGIVQSCVCTTQALERSYWKKEKDVAAMVVEEVDTIVAVVGEDNAVGEDKADDELLAEDKTDKEVDNEQREEDVVAMVVEEVDTIVAVVGEDKTEDELLAEDRADKDDDNETEVVTEDIDNLVLNINSTLTIHISTPHTLTSDITTSHHTGTAHSSTLSTRPTILRPHSAHYTQTIIISTLITNIFNISHSVNINTDRNIEHAPSTEDVTDTTQPVTEAYNMGVAALTLVVVMVLGCALRALLKRYNVQCRAPVRRRPRP